MAPGSTYIRTVAAERVRLTMDEGTDMWWKRPKPEFQPWPKPEPCPPPPAFGTRWRAVRTGEYYTYCEDGRLRHGADIKAKQYQEYSQYDWEFGWRAIGPLRRAP